MPLFLWLFAVAALLYLPAALLAMRLQLPFAAIIVITLQLRVPIFFTQPTLSDDVARFIHDGRAQVAGVNPYRYAPADARTRPYRGPEFPAINHPELPTIYPPVAQHAFRIAAYSAAPLLAWRFLLLGAELIILVAGALILQRRGLPVANLALYAWHPLAIMEGIGSAHVEPLAIAPLVLAVLAVTHGTRVRAGVALATSVGAKLVAAPLLLFLAGRKRVVLAFAATLFVFYLPFVLGGANALGSLGAFADRWESNGSMHMLLASLMGGREYRILAAVLLVIVVTTMRIRGAALHDAAFGYFLALFALSPVVHPWYLLWLLAFVALRSRPLDTIGCAALVWTLTVVLAYTAHQQVRTSGVWAIPQSMLLAEYVPVYAILFAAAVQTAISRARRPHSPKQIASPGSGTARRR